MVQQAIQSSTSTHEVLNQPPPLQDYSVFTSDTALCEGVLREGAEWAGEWLREIGAVAGSAEAIAQGFAANENPPELHTHDRFGHRIDEVSFHPAWHWLMERAVGWGLHALPWREPKRGAHVARAAGFFVWSQVESGHGCPISMTYAAVPALRAQPEVAAIWEPLFTSQEYDFGLRPATTKRGAICGMAMTEKQGGSDVRANTTRAVPFGAGGSGQEYQLTGHKWFCSAPMSDAFLALAQAPGGLSCFLLPRVLPDGTRNAITLERLKEKLGNRSNASSEIELHEAWAVMLGPEGRGVPTIIEMVNHTRLDCVIGSAALMRQAVAQAIHHAMHRHAFGKLLINQPLMRVVLADLAIESEAATALMLRLARATDRAQDDPREAHIQRLGTAIGKYWVSKRAIAVTAEALECLGGNGYVEESIMPRLLREAPVNSIWEGSGNVNCLDVLRALAKEPTALETFWDEIRPAMSDPRIAAAQQRVEAALRDAATREMRARHIVESLALLWQAALLAQHAPNAVADAFCAARLGGEGGLAFGTLPAGADVGAIIERARPHL
jgi:putative acyl-CoA dehydrogenase